ncbi:hypothetical protein WJX84_008777 [Apatococcus fuscideae]|uniref:Uncharacterized protein n=1 Tax=Apatococcus fuscideae TaxID=2026836 RepID=A0AAW1SVU4_9CHLO
MRSSYGRALLSCGVACLCIRVSRSQLTLDRTYCDKVQFGSDLQWECRDAKTLTYGQNNTYAWEVTQEAAQDQAYDMMLTVTTSSGDAAVGIFPPGTSTAPILASASGTGKDVIFFPRSQLTAGTFFVVVAGGAYSTSYKMSFDTLQDPRKSRPHESAALGQLLLDCCAGSACQMLTSQYAELQDNDPTTNPDYCSIVPNVCQEEGHLTQLGLSGMGLSCPFPAAQLTALTYLEALDLSSNSLTGNISLVAAASQSLQSLMSLSLNGNALSGPLPSTCALVQDSMAALDMSVNYISGSIPSCYGQSSTLRKLHLDANDLEGPFPAFSENSIIMSITASNQELNGTVPDLTNLVNLTIFNLEGNEMTGLLPGLPAALWTLDLSGNQMTGELPDAYGNLPQIRTLDLSGNGFSGSFPASEIPACSASQSLAVMSLSPHLSSGSKSLLVGLQTSNGWTI